MRLGSQDEKLLSDVEYCVGKGGRIGFILIQLCPNNVADEFPDEPVVSFIGLIDFAKKQLCQTVFVGPA